MIALSIIVALGLVVFIHEGGHFLCCKWLKIRVLTFAFGFGPELLGFTRGQTRYSICAFPLGGFIKPAGDDPEDLSGAGDEFFAKSWKERILVALAGPAMNYVLSFVLFWFAFWWFGLPDYAKVPVVGAVFSGSPAQAAGIRVGDRVERVRLTSSQSAIAVRGWDELANFIHDHPDSVLILDLFRDNSPLSIEVTSKKDPSRGIGLIGITPQTVYQRVGPFRAASLSVRQMIHYSVISVTYLADRLIRWQKPDLAGPIGIISMMNQAAKSSVADFLGLLAIISVAIGFFNLFPVPMLDGGHVLLYIWEGISRRKITRNFLMKANSVGLAMLIPVFLFAFYNDLERLWNKRAGKSKTEFQEIMKK